MKTKFKKTVAALIIAVCLVTLFGCDTVVRNASGGALNALGADPLVGKWTATIDVASAINKGLKEENEDMADSVDIDEFKVGLIFTFRSDGTYKLSADGASLNTAKDHLAEILPDMIRNYIENLLKEEGSDMTVDEALAANSTTFDEYLKSVVDEVDLEAISSNFAADGRYKMHDGKLMLSAAKNYDVDENMYFNVTVNADRLTLTGSSGYRDEEDLFAGIYPVIFNKQ